MHSAQIISNAASGRPEYAVLPYDDYVSLIRMKAKEEGFDSVEDYLDYHEAANILETNPERIPYEEVLRILEQDEQADA
jgi:hypothetical protein